VSAFVILAAGRGSRIGRVGDSLHKALVPLDGRAVLSHLIGLAPPGARIIICTGHRGAQIMEYISLAHPRAGISFVPVHDWDQPGAGPGASLLTAREEVGDDELYFTSCDTLWEPDQRLWQDEGVSWAATAAMPAGTHPARWCLMQVRPDNTVSGIADKMNVDPGRNWRAYTGLAHIARVELESFWRGVEGGDEVGGERQVTGGLAAIDLTAKEIRWTDVGTEEAYADAVARRTGYDFVKLDEATYVLPDEGRVVKYWKNQDIKEKRTLRLSHLNGTAPAIAGVGQNMLAYRYTPGVTGYAAAEVEEVAGDVMDDLMYWAETVLWEPRDAAGPALYNACLSFYRDKTLDRIDMLRPELASRAIDAVERIDWQELARGARASRIHGDFNLGNVLVTDDGFVGIDWREDFAGSVAWGDIRYDVGKLLAGTKVHWERAQRGDFRPWDRGEANAEVILKRSVWDESVSIIGALSLLNSAPLHAAPLDEVAVARGCAWLQEIL
jgi:dTDP-glucose pyrophosphorylase